MWQTSKKTTAEADVDADFEATFEELIGSDDGAASTADEADGAEAASSKGFGSQRLRNPRDLIGRLWQPKPRHQQSAKTSAATAGSDGDDGSVHGSPQMQWTGASRWKTLLATIGLWVFVGCGALALVLQLAGPHDTSKPVATSGVDQRLLNRKAAAGDTALQFVAAWFSATKTDSVALSKWYDTSQVSLPAKSSTVTNSVVSHADPSNPGVWQITVSADVQPPGADKPTRRYFVVPVKVAGTSQVAAKPLALPAEVAAPSDNVPNISLSYPQQVASTKLQSSIQGFLSALLTGQGPITLYERPGVSIPTISPAPYTSAVVQTVAADNQSSSQALNDVTPNDGATANVLVTVALATAAPSSSGAAQDESSDATATAQYEMTLKARSGRWEVTNLTSAPTLADKPSSTPTPRNTN